MKIVCFYILMFFCFANVVSRAQPDSLVKAAEKPTKDTIDFYKVYNLGKEYVKLGKNEIALSTFNKAFNLAGDIHFEYGQALCLQISGNCYMNLEKDSVAVVCYNKSLAIAKKIKRMSLVAANMAQLAIISTSKSDFAGALSIYKNALALTTKSHDTTIMVGILVNMANLYNRMEDPEKAMIILQDILKISKRLKKDKYTGHIAGQLGNILSDKGDLEEAKVYFNQARSWAKKHGDIYMEAIAISNIAGIEKDHKKSFAMYDTSLAMFKSIQNQFEIARVTHNIGVSLLTEKKYTEALTYLEQASVFFNKAQDYYGLSLVDEQMARAHFKINDLNKAISLAQESIVQSKRCHSVKQEEEACKLLYEIYKEKGDNKNALVYLEKTLLLKDSLNLQKKNNALNVLKTKLELEKQEELLTAEAAVEKQKLLSRVEKEQVEQKAKQTRQLIMSLLILIILIIVCVFSFFLWKRFKIIESQKKLIEQQKEEVEEKQKEILDSIHYAKRIQKALLPPEKYIEKVLDAKRKKTS